MSEFLSLNSEKLFFLFYGFLTAVLLFFLIRLFRRKESGFKTKEELEEQEQELLRFLHSQEANQWKNAPFDPHRILEIAQGATAQEILRKFRDKMKEYHPDVVSYRDDAYRKMALERTIEFIKAKDLLLAEIDKKKKTH